MSWFPTLVECLGGNIDATECIGETRKGAGVEAKGQFLSLRSFMEMSFIRFSK